MFVRFRFFRREGEEGGRSREEKEASSSPSAAAAAAAPSSSSPPPSFNSPCALALRSPSRSISALMSHTVTEQLDGSAPSSRILWRTRNATSPVPPATSRWSKPEATSGDGGGDEEEEEKEAGVAEEEGAGGSTASTRELFQSLCAPPDIRSFITS